MSHVPLASADVKFLVQQSRVASHAKQFEMVQYLAIPATTCNAEHSFSLSARTDAPQQQQMQNAKFGELQKLRAGYMDGRLNVVGEIFEKYVGDFDFCDKDFIDDVAK